MQEPVKPDRKAERLTAALLRRQDIRRCECDFTGYGTIIMSTTMLTVMSLSCLLLPPIRLKAPNRNTSQRTLRLDLHDGNYECHCIIVAAKNDRRAIRVVKIVVEAETM